jgi:putative membrane protein
MTTCNAGRFVLYSTTAVLAAATALAQAPSGGGMPQQQPMPGQQSPGTATPGMNPGVGPGAEQSGDQAFVAKALAGGEAEVQLGQLAQEKSQSSDVKQFAEKMVTDHSQMGNKLKPVAKQMGVAVPNGPDRKEKKLMAKLQTLSGQDFDNAYIAAMVKDHKQDLKDFKDEASSGQDPNVKQIAQQGAMIIQQHLQMIEQIAKSHNVSTDGKQASGSM